MLDGDEGCDFEPCDECCDKLFNAAAYDNKRRKAAKAKRRDDKAKHQNQKTKQTLCYVVPRRSLEDFLKDTTEKELPDGKLLKGEQKCIWWFDGIRFPIVKLTPDNEVYKVNLKRTGRNTDKKHQENWKQVRNMTLTSDDKDVNESIIYEW